MKALRIQGVDTRAIEREVRNAYEANQEDWQAMCGMDKPFPSVLDLIDAKEKVLKAKAVERVGLMRSALNSLRLKKFLRMVENGDDVADITQDEIEAYLDAKNGN